MRFCVVGNCQAEPLGRVMQALWPGSVYVTTPPVHAYRESDCAQVERALRTSHIVFSQLVGDSFGHELLRTSSIRATARATVTWPSLFFDGYAREYGYVRDAAYGNFRGTLGDYHSEKLLCAFFAGWSVARTIEYVEQDSDLNRRLYAGGAEASLASLRAREAEADVRSADLIASMMRFDRVWYTVNHPSIKFLVAFARRLLDHIGEPAHHAPEPWLLADHDLLNVYWPSNPVIFGEGFGFDEPKVFKGEHIVAHDTPRGYKPAGPRFYTTAELVELTFAFYEHNREPLLAHAKVRAGLERFGS